MFNRTKQILFIGLIFCSGILFSQTGQNTPYSRYGIGELTEPFFVKGNSMGNTGAAIDNDSLAPYYVNIQNPASYATLRMATFETGATFQYSKLATSNASSTNKHIAPRYLSLGFPIYKWWGAAVSILPYSSMNYDVTTTKEVFSGLDSIYYNYKGAGGINRLVIGNGFKIGNSLKLGANVSYYFGSLVNERRAIFDGDPTNYQYYYNTRNIQSLYIRKWYADYGIQYTHVFDSLRGRNLKENVRITAGGTFGVADNFNATFTDVSENYFTNSFNSEIVKDTIAYVSDVKGTISMPMFWSAGLAVKKGERFLFSIDYRTQLWSGFQFLGAKQNYQDANQIGLGFQYMPNKKAETTYWKRIYYRLGMRYGNSHLSFNNVQLTEKAVALGVGLPVAWSRIYQQYPILNIGVEYGQFGTNQNNLVQQNFLRVTAGITICSRWFIKPKYD